MNTVDVTILDTEYDAEVKAMLQAFYSRSHTPIYKRINEIGVDAFAAKQKLNDYYIGYGHESIAQCGHTVIFIEGVSLLAALAITDSALYNGQESSTRYIPFDAKNCVYTGRVNNSDETFTSQYIDWIQLYKNVFEHALEQLEEEYGKNPTNEKAYKAAAFDKARGFLPLGCKTQLSWSTSLRDLNDNLARLWSFPNNEVQTIAQQIHAAAVTKYPASIKSLILGGQEEYRIRYKTPYNLNVLPTENDIRYKSFIEEVELPHQLPALPNRKKFAPIPQEFSAYRIKGEGVLDIGSFRDLHRHRRGFIGWPLIRKVIDTSNWYCNNLPQNLIDEYVRLMELLPDIQSPEDFDYLLLYPLCTSALFPFNWGLDQLIYVAELRSQQTVHPTLRSWIIDLWKKSNAFNWNTDQQGEKLINVHIDTADNTFSFKRGEQDIIKIA